MKSNINSPKLNIEEEENLYQFKRFLQLQVFSEVVCKSGNFRCGTPIFYKRKNTNNFLVFNIPYNSEQHRFYADFWIINTQSEKNFLIKKVDENSLHNICLGFTMKNVKLYDKLVL